MRHLAIDVRANESFYADVCGTHSTRSNVVDVRMMEKIRRREVRTVFWKMIGGDAIESADAGVRLEKGGGDSSLSLSLSTSATVESS